MLRRTTAKIYYWYAEGGREVDFVIKSQNQPVAINVSYGEEIPERELESFEAFLKVATPQRSILVTRNKFEKKTISQNTVELIPLWVFAFLKLPQ
jgi:predicted AAA+ superfamily ATPase